MPEQNIKRHVRHLKSNVVTNAGYPKIPNPNDILYGEIAVNYADGLETISLKNSNNTITRFTPNTNVFVKLYPNPLSDNAVSSALSVRNVYNYRDFNLYFLEPINDDYNLFNIVDYIRTTYYDVCDIHLMLNVATTRNGNDCERHTVLYLDTEELQGIIGDVEDSLMSDKSSVIGFTKHDNYLIAGDSEAINGIEINWDSVNKTMTVRFAYVDTIQRMDGNSI